METAALIAYALQAVRFALSLVRGGSREHAILSQFDADLTLMQAEGNRGPNEAERAKVAAMLDQLAQLPAQG